MHIKKSTILILLFSLIFIFSIYLIDVYNNLKFGRNLNSILVTLGDLNDSDFEDISIYKISPKGNVNLFNKNKFTKSFFDDNPGYCKEIKIIIPDEIIKDINNLKIIVKDKKNNISNQEMQRLISSSNLDRSKTILIDNKKLGISSSIIPLFKKIINWPGDVNYFFINYIYFFIIYFAMFFILLLFIKKTNMVNNNEINFELNEEKYKCLYRLIFLSIISFAIILRFVINNVPYALGDVWGYIGPAINYFENGKFIHVSGRGFPYPFIVFLILKFTNSFFLLSIIQHLIGIVTGIILLAVWNRLADLFGFDIKVKIIHSITGLLLLGLFLFSEAVIVYENHLMRESIYPFFLILQVIFLVNFIYFIKNNKKHLYIWGILFFVNNYFLFVYQPRWGFTIIFNILVYTILYFIIKNQNNFKKILLLIITPLLFSFIFIYLPENVLIKSETATESFLAKHLFFGHAKIVDIELKKDIADIRFNKYDKEILKKVREAFSEEFNKKNTRKHKYLGYDFNRLVYDGWINEYLITNLKNKYQKFCLYYFVKSIFKHPFMYMKKVLLELSQFYNFGNMYPNKIYQIDHEIYNYSFYELYNMKNSSYIPFIIYIDSLYHLGNSNIDIKEYRVKWVNSFIFILSKLYLILFGAFLTLFVKHVFTTIKEKQYSTDFILYIIVFILYFYNFFINITIASIYTFDVERYIDDQFIIVLLSEVLTIEFISIKLYNFFIKGKIK